MPCPAPQEPSCCVWMEGFHQWGGAEHPEEGDTGSWEYAGRMLLQSIEHKSQGICSSVNELSQDMVFVFGLRSIAKLPVMLVRGGFSAGSVSGLWQFGGSTCGVSSAVGFWCHWSVFSCG